MGGWAGAADEKLLLVIHARPTRRCSRRWRSLTGSTAPACMQRASRSWAALRPGGQCCLGSLVTCCSLDVKRWQHAIFFSESPPLAIAQLNTAGCDPAAGRPACAACVSSCMHVCHQQLPSRPPLTAKHSARDELLCRFTCQPGGTGRARHYSRLPCLQAEAAAASCGHSGHSGPAVGE